MIHLETEQLQNVLAQHWPAAVVAAQRVREVHVVGHADQHHAGCAVHVGVAEHEAAAVERLGKLLRLVGVLVAHRNSAEHVAARCKVRQGNDFDCSDSHFHHFFL